MTQLDCTVDGAGRKHPVSPVTIDDLRSGRRVRISEREYSLLDGTSVYTKQKNRWLGKGTPFQKDENGRIWYRAEDVLADIDRKVHRSTSEYDTSESVERLSKARTALTRSDEQP